MKTSRWPRRPVYAPLAMSANSGRLDQFEEGNAAGGHASEVEDSAVSPSMTSADSNADGRAKAGAPRRCPRTPKIARLRQSIALSVPGRRTAVLIKARLSST
jgi:hypothetical protein